MICGVDKMGWSSYIIIPRLKLVIETNREIEDIEFYQKESIDEMLDEENIDDGEYIDLKNVKICDITIKNLALLYKDYEIVKCIRGIHIDRLFLYWLMIKGIDFSVKSESSIDREKYKSEGYSIIER